MSADQTPMPEPPATAISQIDEAVAKINEAMRINERLQKQFKAPSPEWHMCETIDDKLFDALRALGQ